MGRRDDFYNTLKHKRPGKLILDLGGCPLSTLYGKSEDKVLDFLGYKKDLYKETGRIDERILKYLDIDTRSAGEILRPLKSQYKKLSETEYIDEWGMKRRFTGMYWDIVTTPLKGADVYDLKNYPWPDPLTVDLKKVEYHVEKAKDFYFNTDYIVCAEHPVYGIFELGCWMFGFDDFLMKMVLEEDVVKTFFEIILDYQKKIIDIYYEMMGPYAHYTSSGDDFAMQKDAFFSPEMFAKFIKPYFKERISYTRKYTDAYFLHHSCGNVFKLIPDLIEAGVDILNPIQPVTDSMSPESLKKNFGDNLCFHGGIDTQAILPFGSREQIETEVKDVIDVMSEGGGYIFAAAHNIQEDVPPENLIIMFQAARRLYK